MQQVDFFASIISSILSSGIVLFLVQRYFSKRDSKEEEERELRKSFYKKIDAGLETIRLLAYHRMSEEIERLLNKGYASPAERRVIDEMYSNYKEHGWNGDMDARLEKVYKLRTDHPESR